jgi:endonuclease VIII
MLLDQAVACGIGNIYKCESLWLERRAPSTPIASLDDAALAALFARARELMQASVAGRRRPFQVYRRAGEPCPRCRTRIASEVEGGELRRTYWCPACQAL